jgi:hypothetical protein
MEVELLFIRKLSLRDVLQGNCLRFFMGLSE